jgi:AhpD family alkylhydroperoxidase
VSTKLAYKAVRGRRNIGAFNIGAELAPLVNLRISQLNRCLFCLGLHMREARALGESDDRLSGLAAWREAPWYSARERAALEWAEALTFVAFHEIPNIC